MEKKFKIVIIVLFIVIIAGAGFGAYEMEIGPFEEDDDDDDNGNGENGPVEDEKPVAIIAANRTTGDPNWLFNFNGSGSYDDETNITTYDWNFGDGNTEQNMSAEHSWIQPGAYNVTLTVTDTDGNFNRTWMWVGITYREHQDGNTNGATETFDFDMVDNAAIVYVNTTLENRNTNVGDNNVTVRLYFAGTEVWEHTADLPNGVVAGVDYSNQTNLTADTWTWELVVNDSGPICDLDWEVEVVIVYAEEQ